MVVQTQLMTAEELWETLDLGGRVELVKGELVTMSPGGHFHGRVGARALVFLGQFGLEQHLGEVYTAKTGFILSRNPDTVRAPDAAFVAAERVGQQDRQEGYFVGAPDLAVEIVSPNDTSAEVEQKVLDYLDAGTRMVWVFYPNTKRVFVHRGRGQARVLTVDDSLDGEDVIPGFRVPLSDIFDY